MSTSSGKELAKAAVRPAMGLGPGLIVLALVAGSVAALWPARIPESGPATESTASSVLSSAASNGEAQPAAAGDSAPARINSPAPLLPPDSGATEPAPETRRLVQNLVHLESEGGILAAERVATWKKSWQELVQQGAAAVPAISEFLTQNVEYSFTPEARELLGYDSARIALVDALAQIGGSEAINALSVVLQTTAQPREIAMLAQDLEQLEPGQHRDQVLDAARQTLDMATTRKLEMPDVAPLFEVLQRYGGQTALGDLVKACAQWNYYGTIALAQLPDEAGIPSLVQMAQNPGTTAAVRDATLQALAEVADRSAEARSALVNLARLNLVTPFTWQMVASTLAGEQVGLLNSAFENHQALPQVSGFKTVATSDNQNFFAVPANLTPEQADQRIALIDQLLSGTSDSTAAQALQQSRARLSRRFLDHSHS